MKITTKRTKKTKVISITKIKTRIFLPLWRGIEGDDFLSNINKKSFIQTIPLFDIQHLSFFVKRKGAMAQRI